jgi:hypothetical protein
MRNELLAKADAALASVDLTLSQARNAAAVDRLIDSAALGTGYTAIFHPSLVDSLDPALRSRWVWAALGCDDVDCRCEDTDLTDDLGFRGDRDMHDYLERVRYSYEQIEVYARTRQLVTQLALDIGSANPLNQKG